MPNEIHNVEVAEKLLEKAIASMMEKLETFEFTGSPEDLASSDKFEQAYAIMENYDLINQLIRFMDNQWKLILSSKSSNETNEQVKAQQENFNRTIKEMYNWQKGKKYQPPEQTQNWLPEFSTDTDFYKKFVEVKECLNAKANDPDLADNQIKMIAFAVNYARDKPKTTFWEYKRIHYLFNKLYDTVNNPSLKLKLERLGITVKAQIIEATTPGRKPTLQVQRKDTNIKSLTDILLLAKEKVDLIGGETSINQELRALVTSLREEEVRLLTESRTGTLAESATSVRPTTTRSNKENILSPQMENRGLSTQLSQLNKEEETEVSKGKAKETDKTKAKEKVKLPDDSRKLTRTALLGSTTTDARQNMQHVLIKKPPQTTSSVQSASPGQKAAWEVLGEQALKKISEAEKKSATSAPVLKETGKQVSTSPQAIPSKPKKPDIQKALQLSHSVSVTSLSSTQNKSRVEQLSHTLQTTVSTTVRDEDIIEQMNMLRDGNTSNNLTLIERIILLDKLLKEARYSREVFQVYEEVNTHLTREFANQIIDMDRQSFKNVDMDRFLKLDTTEPNMLALIANFNKLSQLATYCILISNVNLRILMLQRMIRIAQIFDEKGDYNACMALLSAFGSSSVLRLKNTFEGLPPATKAILKKLEDKYSPTKSFQKLRIAYEDPTKLTVPSTAMFKGDLTFVTEGNKNKHLFDTEGGVKIVSTVVKLHKQLTQSDSKPLSAHHDFQDYFNAYENQNPDEFDKMAYELSQKDEAKGKKIKSKIADLYTDLEADSEDKRPKRDDLKNTQPLPKDEKKSTRQDEFHSAIPSVQGAAGSVDATLASLAKAEKANIVPTDIELLKRFDKLLEESNVLSHPGLIEWGKNVSSDSFSKILDYNQPESFVEVSDEEWKKLQKEFPQLANMSPDKITQKELFELNNKYKLWERIQRGTLKYKVYEGKLVGELAEPGGKSTVTFTEKAPRYVYSHTPPGANKAETTDEPFTALYSIKNGKLVIRRITTDHRASEVAALLQESTQKNDINEINVVTKTLGEIDNYINILMRQALANKILNLDLFPAFYHIINQKYDQLIALLNKNQTPHNNALREALVLEKQRFNLFAKDIEETISKHNRELKTTELQKYDFTDDLNQMNKMLEELNRDPAIRNIFDKDYDPTAPSLVEHLKPEAIELLKVEDLGFSQLASDNPDRVKKIAARALLLAQERAARREFKDIMQGAYGIVLIEHGGQRGHHRDQAANAAVEAYQRDQNANPALKKLIKAFADVYALIGLVRAMQEEIGIIRSKPAVDFERLDEKLKLVSRKLEEVNVVKQRFKQEMEQYNKHEYRPLIAQAEQFRRVQYAHKPKDGQPGYREPTQEELQNISVYIDADTLRSQGLNGNPVAPYSTNFGSVYSSLSKPMWMVMNGGQNLHVPGEDRPRIDPIGNRKFNAAIRDNDPNLLSPKARGLAGNVTRAITVKLDAYGGWNGPVNPYAEHEKPTVLMLARGAPQLDDPELVDYKRCIIDRKSDIARFAAVQEQNQGKATDDKRYLLLRNQNGNYIVRNADGTFAQSSKLPPVEERVYLDIAEYIKMKKQEIRGKLSLLNDKQNSDSEGRAVYFKTPVIGVGAFSFLGGNDKCMIGKMLEPLFFQAYHDVLTEDEESHKYTHENMIIEFIAYGDNDESNSQLRAFREVFEVDKGVANISGVTVKVLAGKNDTKGVSPTDYQHVENREKYILSGDVGADNGSVFGNELDYYSLEAEVANDAASSRGVGSPLINPLMLDPQHQFVFDGKKYVTVAEHLRLTDEQIEASKPVEVRDLENWNKYRKDLLKLIFIGNFEEFKKMMIDCKFSDKGKQEILKALHEIVKNNSFDGKDLPNKEVLKQVSHFMHGNKYVASQYRYFNIIQTIAVEMGISLEGVEKIKYPENNRVHNFFELWADFLISGFGKRENGEADTFEENIRNALLTHTPSLTSPEKLEVLELIFNVIKKNQSLKLDNEQKPMPYYQYIDKGGAIFKAKQEGTDTEKEKHPLTGTQMQHIKSLKAVYLEVVQNEYDSKMGDKKDSVKKRTMALASVRSAIDKEDGLVDFSNSNFLLPTGDTGTREKINQLKAPPSLSKVYVTSSASSKDTQAAKTRNLNDDLNKVVDEIIAAQNARDTAKAALLVQTYLGKDNTFLEKARKAIFGNTREQFVKLAAEAAEADIEEDPLTRLITSANIDLAKVISDTGIMASSHWPENNGAKKRISEQLDKKIRPVPLTSPSVQGSLNTEMANPLYEGENVATTSPSSSVSSSTEMANPSFEGENVVATSPSSSVSSLTEMLNPPNEGESVAATSSSKLTAFEEYYQSVREKQKQKRQSTLELPNKLQQAIEQLNCIALKEFLLERYEAGKIANLPTDTFINGMVAALNKFHKHDIPTYPEYIRALGGHLLGEAKDLADDGGKNNFSADFKEKMEQFRSKFEEDYLAKLNKLHQGILSTDLTSKLNEVESLQNDLLRAQEKLRQSYDEKRFRFYKITLDQFENKIAEIHEDIRHHSHAVEKLVAELNQDVLFNKHMSREHRAMLSDLAKIEISNEQLQAYDRSLDGFKNLKDKIEKEREPSLLSKLSNTLLPKPSSKDH